MLSRASALTTIWHFGCSKSRSGALFCFRHLYWYFKPPFCTFCGFGLGAGTCAGICAASCTGTYAGTCKRARDARAAEHRVARPRRAAEVPQGPHDPARQPARPPGDTRRRHGGGNPDKVDTAHVAFRKAASCDPSDNCRLVPGRGCADDPKVHTLQPGLEAALCRCKATKLYWRRCFE